MAKKKKENIDLGRILGRTAIFDPFEGDKGPGVKELSCAAKGTIVYVNRKHKWFSVMYRGIRTSFSFSDIGKTVTVM